MTVDPVLVLVALLVAGAAVAVGRFAGRRSPGPLCRTQPDNPRATCPVRCPACTHLAKETHQ